MFIRVVRLNKINKGENMSIQKVKDFFKNYNLENRVLEFCESSATVELAAKAVGCKSGEIAKTMSFMVNEKPILIVLAGDTKIDNKKFKEEFKTKATMLAFDLVEELIGHAVGGVCPFAINDGVEVYLDNALKRFEVVYPACGSSNSAIGLNIFELEKYSNYKKWINVSKLIQE